MAARPCPIFESVQVTIIVREKIPHTIINRTLNGPILLVAVSRGGCSCPSHSASGFLSLLNTAGT